MTRIYHAGNTRMIEIRQKLVLLEETVAPGGPIGSGVEDLDGNLLLNLTIAALGQIDRAHAAGAKQPNQAVWSAVAELPSLAGAQHLVGSIGLHNRSGKRRCRNRS
jgi:hypothetical protein